MKLAIGTAIIGTTVLAGILLAPSLETETTIQEIRTSENHMLPSLAPGTYVQYAVSGFGETCASESWNVPYEYDSINAFKADHPDAQPVKVTESVFPAACKDNSNVAAGDMPLTPPSYGYQWGIRPSDHMYDTPA